MGRRVVRKPVIGLALLWCAGIEISLFWSYKATHVESSLKENTRKSAVCEEQNMGRSEKEGKTTYLCAGRSAIYGPDQSPELALKNHEFNFPDP
jgi:hypothetical protein